MRAGKRWTARRPWCSTPHTRLAWAFDAARSYGAAEASLASWLERRGLSPEDVRRELKWGYAYTAGWRVHADRHEVKTSRRRQWAETDELLGEHVRPYQFHSATLESGVLADTAVPEELAALRVAGSASDSPSPASGRRPPSSERSRWGL